RPCDEAPSDLDSFESAFTRCKLTSCMTVQLRGKSKSAQRRCDTAIFLDQGQTMPASRLLYGVTVFLGAFLLFLVEPMAAKQLLPTLGGSSAVWLTCLVFFQTTLLLGYLYAHWLTREAFDGWRQLLYLALLVIAVILLVAQLARPANSGHGADHPVTTIFVALSVTIGLPFLLLASTSPLLPVFLVRSEGSKVSYRLFALSNSG